MTSQFALAVHVLTLLALDEESSSRDLAESVNSNPVILRRLLSKLKGVGLVQVARGSTGGYRLAKDASRIRLSEVYNALGETPFNFHPNPPNPKCPIGANITPVLKGVFCEAETKLIAGLAKRTIADLKEEIHRQSGKKKKAG